MTALEGYERLEAVGLWRPGAGEQRREVIVSLGEATLTISDIQNRALTHWSLAAVSRGNRGNDPALFHPEGDDTETLELPSDEAMMIEGIDRLITAINRHRPQPGKLRWYLGGAAALVVLALVFFWLPGALIGYTARVVPEVKREEIGRALLSELTRMTGEPCRAPEAMPALRSLAGRVLGPGRGSDLVVVPEGVSGSAHLPGGTILLSREVIEGPEDPDVPAGYVLVESLRAATHDPLHDLLRHAGLWSSLRLLTTGELPAAALDDYADDLLTGTPRPLDDAKVIEAFTAAELRSRPYAYHRDPSGERVLALIEGDPRAVEGSRTVLSDSAWLRLQSICDG